MGKLTNMTIKGQVTIPKDVRDALGLKPNEPVEIEYRGGEEAVIRKPKVDTVERRDQILRRLEAAMKKYVHLRTGQSTDEIMREIRGDDPFPS